MPFYEYECQACKFYTEVMQKITDTPLAKCPSCGKRALKKLVSAPVFRLKGAGWYETDFKSDKESKRNLLAVEKEEAKAESKPEAKEGKPEAKEGKPEPKESKSEAKEAKEGKERKAAEPKGAEPKAAGTPARRSVSVPGRAARAATRRPTHPARTRGARKRRR